MPLICPECSTSNPDEARFCLHCGTRLDSPTDAPAAAGATAPASPDDAPALAAALGEALALGASARDAMARRARAHVAGLFSLEGMQSSTLEVYTAVIGGRRRVVPPRVAKPSGPP